MRAEPHRLHTATLSPPFHCLVLRIWASDGQPLVNPREADVGLFSGTTTFGSFEVVLHRKFFLGHRVTAMGLIIRHGSPCIYMYPTGWYCMDILETLMLDGKRRLLNCSYTKVLFFNA